MVVGESLSEAVLREIYRDIKQYELKLGGEDLHHGSSITFLGADKEGWLKKKGTCVERVLFHAQPEAHRRDWHPKTVVPFDG